MFAGIDEDPSDIPIPKTLREAQDSKNWPKWEEAINVELQQLIRNGTWIEVTRPKNVHLVGSKWVFDLKKNTDGTIARFKARLVAQGFTQKHNVDYDETYAPVGTYTALRILIALAAFYDWDIRQIDISTAFLHGRLKHKIFMRAPNNIHVQNGKVLRLIKTLYGLKQSSREWYERLREELLIMGFNILESDTVVFMNRKSHIILWLYVDDILFFVPKSERGTVDTIIQRLASVFDLRDLGEAKQVLNMTIHRDRKQRLIRLRQDLHIVKLINKYRKV